MLKEVRKYGGEVEFDAEVVGVGQDEDGEVGGRAWVEVKRKGGEVEREEADYVVGCDGANSIVRRSLFGDQFPGFTWDAQIIATNVCLLFSLLLFWAWLGLTWKQQTFYDFEGKFGWHDANFIVHPENFFVSAPLLARKKDQDRC